MKATYIQIGNAIDYVNGAANPVEFGEVIAFAAGIGVAGSAILPGETGIVHLTGVWEFPCAEAIAQGAPVYWDDTDKVFTLAETDTPAGMAVADSSGSAVRLRIG
jgi:predicted RecA/RadA family phage recombinase